MSRAAQIRISQARRKRSEEIVSIGEKIIKICEEAAEEIADLEFITFKASVVENLNPGDVYVLTPEIEIIEWLIKADEDHLEDLCEYLQNKDENDFSTHILRKCSVCGIVGCGEHPASDDFGALIVSW